jgi:hypothetical protein
MGMCDGHQTGLALMRIAPRAMQEGDISELMLRDEEK